MRGGNSFVGQGDLIRGLKLNVTAGSKAAAMGEKLTVSPGQKVIITVKVYVPEVNNNCPYSFPNPALAQPQVSGQFPNGIPNLNRPVLHHVDLIRGSVTGRVQPGTPHYTQISSDAAIKQTVPLSRMKDEGNGWKSFTFPFTPTRNCYFRLRGTNLPPNTPHETDPEGNPLSDTLAKNILYNGNTPLAYDVAAWADLWFYSNPIFIRLRTAPDF
jgi:hypothetical protein